MSTYDVIIVGAGPAGIFAAYEFTLKKPTAKVLLIDKGNDIYHRRCPILEKKIDKCPPTNKMSDYQGCLPTCSITGGWGGAGAYSDGKFNITTHFGGWMSDYLPHSEVLNLIKYVDNINLSHGAPNEVAGTLENTGGEIEVAAARAGLKLLPAEVRHLGTEVNLQVLTSIYEYLKNKITIKHKTLVDHIIIDKPTKRVIGLQCHDAMSKKENITEYFYSPNIIIAPGRDGSEWLMSELKKYGIKLNNNQVDVGVRVELPYIVMKHITDELYEGKFLYKSNKYQDVIRTFCTNPRGHVVVENHTGVMTANGHSYKDPKLGSENTNFALLVSHQFTEPFNQPIEYAKSVARMANMLSNGGIIVQRFGDLVNGRRSKESSIKKNFVEPTMKEAVPGDLNLVMPKRTVENIIEMIYALDKIAPGTAGDDTLLYGVETKFYSARPKLTNEFETEIKGLYCLGDGAGLTRGLAQAGASGIHAARSIIKKLS